MCGLIKVLAILLKINLGNVPRLINVISILEYNQFFGRIFEQFPIFSQVLSHVKEFRKRNCHGRVVGIHFHDVRHHVPPTLGDGINV